MIYALTHKTKVFLNLQQLSVIECKKRKGSVTLARSCAIGDFQEQPRWRVRAMKEYDKMICKDEQSQSFFSRFLRNFVEVFSPMDSDPRTIFLRDLRRISPVDLFQSLPLTHRPILFDLRSRHELDCFPFTICDSLQVADLDWEALLYSVPPRNVVILYGSNDKSVARMTISALPAGCEVWMLRGGLQEWCETGLPVNGLHHQQVRSEQEAK